MGSHLGRAFSQSGLAKSLSPGNYEYERASESVCRRPTGFSQSELGGSQFPEYEFEWGEFQWGQSDECEFAEDEFDPCQSDRCDFDWGESGRDESESGEYDEYALDESRAGSTPSLGRVADNPGEIPTTLIEGIGIEIVNANVIMAGKLGGFCG